MPAQPNGGAESGDGVYWTAKIYDEVKGQAFRIKAYEEEIHVFPLDEDFGFGTFARFVEFVQENIDHRAEVVVQDD